MTTAEARPWTVLLIGGGSGTGKTRAAEFVARRYGVPWLQVDDFRLALQRATSPSEHPGLHYFVGNEPVWGRPENDLLDALKAIAREVSSALEGVIAHHVATGSAVVMEGDGLEPRMAAGTHFAGYDAAGAVRAIFLVEARQEAVAEAIRARGSRGGSDDESTYDAQARVAWLYGQWVQSEALRLGLPVVAARPYERLEARLARELR
jgi:2-phosphoglycerate kinase